MKQDTLDFAYTIWYNEENGRAFTLGRRKEKSIMTRYAAARISRIKWWVCVALTFCMLVASMIPAYAELDEPIMLDDCDSASWAGGAGRDFKDFTQGKASLSWTIPEGGGFVVFRTLNKPVNATGANYIAFDFYVSSADMFYSISGGNSLELTSSGTCDQEETAWNLTDFDVQDGWNEIELPLRDGCDWSRVNYIRFYALTHNNEER